MRLGAGGHRNGKGFRSDRSSLVRWLGERPDWILVDAREGAMMSAASTVVAAPQHMEALAHANRVRLARASLKRAILAGQADVVEVVRNCPWEVDTMTVGELL